MGCVSTAACALPRRRRGAGTALGGVGAALGLLLPKCPLCWMALAGSFAGAARMQWGVEAAGTLLFALAVVMLLRRRMRVGWLVMVLAGSAMLFAAGTRLMVGWQARLGLWLLVAASIGMMGRWSSRRGERAGCVEGGCGTRSTAADAANG